MKEKVEMMKGRVWGEGGRGEGSGGGREEENIGRRDFKIWRQKGERICIEKKII